MFDKGADVVYQAAGGSGGGVFEAAKDAGGFAIGVDSDQYNTADPAVKDVIMTSMLKKVDVAVYDFISRVVDGDFTAGAVDLRPREGRRGLLDERRPDRRHHGQADEDKAQIIDGTITVPTE